MKTRRKAARQSWLCAAGLIAATSIVLLLPSNALAVRCGLKQAPPDPYGVSYGSINVPSAPGTYNVYYSFWSSPDNYRARRIRPDGTFAWDVPISGGNYDFTNSVDVERRTQLKNTDGLSGWSYWVQSNSMTSC